MGLQPDLLIEFVHHFIPLVFTVVSIGVIVTVWRKIRQWGYDNGQPLFHTAARVIDKRANVYQRPQPNEQTMYRTGTSYYVTFELESGDRVEFEVNGSEYGHLISGDTGKIKFRGSRFYGFERTFAAERGV